MRHRLLLAALLSTAPVALGPAQSHVTAVAAAGAPVAKEQLLKPPADATHYVVASLAGKHGDQWMWTLPDGRIAVRYSQSLRGWITEVDQVMAVDAAGRTTRLAIRGVTPSGDANETFALEGGKASWTSSADRGSIPATGAYYLPAGGTSLGGIPMVRALVAAGDKGIDLYPSGHASIERGKTLTIQGPQGAKTVQLAWIRGVLPSPVPIWLDDKGAYFADIGTISTLPAGYEPNIKAMIDFQDKETAAAIAGVARKFLAPASLKPVLFDHVRLFDSVGGRFVDDQAVLVAGGKIVAVGAGGSIKADGARVIDGRGKTLVPGLWDSHLHIGDDWSVLMNMATGITSFRSPGTEIARAVDAIQRRKAGTLLMGEPFVSQIIDKKDPLAAQGAEVVSSEAEAIAAVHRIHDAGLWGVKFYTSMNPKWIAPAAREAHKLGMHVHGHVPATMRPLDAVRAGYDEITHINFVAMQAMPQAVVDQANTAQRMEGPAKYFKDVDLNAEPMKGFIAELARRGTAVDPTLVTFEAMFKSDGGTPAEAYAPYMGILSPVLDRSFKAGGYPLVAGYSRDDYRKSYAKLVQLVGALHKAGVTVVAGTDGQGIELVREIELYRDAGFTPAEALQAATIVPARMMGADKRTGSISVGKEADLVLVDGNVASDLGALRRVVTVVSDGHVMDGDALRTAAGFSGRPK
jgi:imidazolonepropionase-like amidohydrolase